MINGSFCDRDNAQHYAPDLSDQDSQYAPTPGYYNDTLHSYFEFSSSPDRYPQGSSVASICVPQETPRLLQVREWKAIIPDDEFPPTFIRYCYVQNQIPPRTLGKYFSSPTHDGA
ncbi:unnamed protein product, partial [Penicillium pancosmium]